MINKDYILRLAELMGRELAIVLGLRKREQYQEALIAIDDLLLRMSGFTSCSLNALPAETLLAVLSPLGVLQSERCLCIATLLKAEGQIYEEQHHFNESFYRYCKSLFLFIAALRSERIDDNTPFSCDIDELLQKVEYYELPINLKAQLFWYYEWRGDSAKAEDMLFELPEIV